MKNPFSGLFRARDKPQDSVSAAPVFYFGTSGSGKSVTVQSAIQLSTVYACVRVISETIASLPLCIYETVNDGNEKATDHPFSTEQGKWNDVCVASILTNETYMGDKILQKTYTLDFLHKTPIKNTGQVPMHHIEQDHEAIIAPDAFRKVQDEILRRKNKPCRGMTIISGRIFCAECGASFGPKVWHSNGHLEENSNANDNTPDADSPKCVWFIYTASETPIDWPEVEKALNAYSEEKIGVTCEFRFMDETQIAQANQAGEYFDIAFTSDWWNDFATEVGDGMFLKLDDYLDAVPALKESVLDKAWEGAKVNGGIYAIPHMKDIGYEVFWILNSDFFLNEASFAKDLYISFEGIEPYFEAYKKEFPDDYPFKTNSNGITSWQNCLVDWLDFDCLIGLEWEAQGTENEHVVKSALETDAWKNRLRKIHEWYQKGYINPDASVTESMPRAQAGVVQSGQGWIGADTVWANVIKQPIYISRYDGAYLNTSSIRGAMTAISSSSEHKEEALKLVELMNTDPWYRETARYGIEGKHYTRNDDGTVTRTEQGSDNMNVQAYAQGHYTVGALESSPFPEVPTDTHQWEKTMAGYADATLSAAMGFTPNTQPVQTECLAIKKVIDEYSPELYTGTSDPDVVIPEMLLKMKEVGLEKVKAEIQSQLDAFLAK